VVRQDIIGRSIDDGTIYHVVLVFSIVSLGSAFGATASTRGLEIPRHLPAVGDFSMMQIGVACHFGYIFLKHIVMFHGQGADEAEDLNDMLSSLLHQYYIGFGYSSSFSPQLLLFSEKVKEKHEDDAFANIVTEK